MPAEKARPLIGKLLKDYGTQAMAHALTVCQQNNPADPRAYLLAVLAKTKTQPATEHQPWLSLRECGCLQCQSELKRLEAAEKLATA